MVARRMMGNLANEVEEWLGLDGEVSLELPGRWFGRPMDNHHRLTWAASGPFRSVLEFDGQLSLLLCGPQALEIDGSVASISAERIVFDWKQFGAAGHYQTEAFEDGVVRLHLH